MLEVPFKSQTRACLGHSHVSRLPLRIAVYNAPQPDVNHVVTRPYKLTHNKHDDDQVKAERS